MCKHVHIYMYKCVCVCVQMIVARGRQVRVKHNFSLRVQGRATHSLEVTGQSPSKRANDSNVATQLRTSCTKKTAVCTVNILYSKEKRKKKQKTHLTLVGLPSSYFRFPKRKEEGGEERERELNQGSYPRDLCSSVEACHIYRVSISWQLTVVKSNWGKKSVICSPICSDHMQALAFYK